MYRKKQNHSEIITSVKCNEKQIYLFFVIDKPKYIKDGCLPSVLQSNSNLKLESSVKKDL